MDQFARMLNLKSNSKIHTSLNLLLPNHKHFINMVSKPIYFISNCSIVFNFNFNDICLIFKIKENKISRSNYEVEFLIFFLVISKW